MPRKNGHLTRQETVVAAVYAETGSQGFAAHKAGISQPGASLALQRPAVQAEIARLQTEKLFNVALPAAVACVIEVLTNAKAPAGARVQAAKLTFDRTLGVIDGAQGKEAHEMSGSELADAIARLEDIAAARAKPVTPPEISVFD